MLKAKTDEYKPNLRNSSPHPMLEKKGEDQYEDLIGPHLGRRVTQPSHISTKGRREADIPPRPTMADQSKLTGRKYHLKAKDCRKPQKISSYLFNETCTPLETDTPAKTTTMYLIQKIDNFIRPGLRCSKKESVFREMCGAYSHMKLLEPPKVSEPVTMKKEDCLDVLNSHQYTDARGRSHSVSPGKDVKVYTSYLRHGKTTITSNNVYCDGANVVINNEPHEQVLEYVATEVSFSWVDVVHREDGSVEDLDNKREVVSACERDIYCANGLDSYAFFTHTKRCSRLKLIKKIEARIETVEIGDQLKHVVISDRDHIFLPVVQSGKVPSGCEDVAEEIFETEFADLMVVQAIHATNIGQLPTVSPQDVKVLLSERVEDTFLVYKTKTMLRDQAQKMGQELCSLGQETWTESDRSVLHKATILRKRGELLQEIHCKEVEVTVWEGEKLWSSCFETFLPVRYGSEMLVLAANSRMLMKMADVMKRDCDNILAPVFITEEGQYIVSDPYIRTIPVTIHHRKSALLSSLGESEHLHLETEDIYSKELLYTAEEESKFDLFVHFSSMRSALSEAFDHQYCSSGTCGSVETSADFGGFDMGNLSTTELIPGWWNWLEKIWRIVWHVGTVCSVLVVLQMLFSAVSYLHNLFKFKRQGYKLQTARKLVNEPWRQPIREQYPNEIQEDINRVDQDNFQNRLLPSLNRPAHPYTLLYTSEGAQLPISLDDLETALISARNRQVRRSTSQMEMRTMRESEQPLLSTGAEGVNQNPEGQDVN